VAKLRRNDQYPGPLRAALTRGPAPGGTEPPPGAGTSWLVTTPRGDARIDLDRPDHEAGTLLVLGHGAGGDVTAPDLLAVRDAALGAGVTVARITQPYRVAGRRAPAPANHLDEAWSAAVTALRALPSLSAHTLVLGGRSSGARVACRTAPQLGAAGVIALAFPEHPPGKPDRSRGAELRSGVPTLVVNGDRDPFGVPAPFPGGEIRIVPGDHSLKKDPAAVALLVVGWLRAHGWAG
jgi:predicted alpha/beta-hydrolase family hydrolase